ncbi:hypothetical protein ACFVXW_37045 [Streptomyces sp. NPDC058251]|uniref:hypothetical protein n=1 Tax=Streptomyces sp. NPDC058251 TaxID=3346404 RepID=UPI0036E686C3
MVLGSDLRRENGRGAAAATVVALVLAAALTACGDDSGGGGSSAPPLPSAQRSTSAEPSPTAPSDPAAAEQEVKKNWEKFFDPAVPQKDKQAVLENGDRMTKVLQSFNGDKRGQEVQAKVEKVEFTSPAGANVTYSLTLKGATALPGASGTAVEQDGTWKVSVKTLCALVQLSGNASPGPGC